MENKLIAGIVAAAIAIIVLAGVLMPALDNATTVNETFTNKGRYYVTTEIADDVTITMTYDNENNVRSWYVDGVLLEYDALPGTPEFVYAPTVIGTDNFVFRADGRSRGLNSATGASDYIVTVTDDSVTTGTKVGNAPLIVASTSETDNIMRYSNTVDSYILGDSEIIACGYTGSIKIGEDQATDIVISFKGSIDDGVQITTFNQAYTFTVSNVQINADSVSGFNDLYKFDSVTFDVTYTDTDTNTDYVTACTYSMVVLPAEVTAERSVHLTDAMNVILNVVPLLIIVSVLLAVVAVFILRRE